MNRPKVNSLDQTLNTLCLSGSKSLWESEWLSSEEAGTEKISPYLQEAYVREACAWLGASACVSDLLVKALDLFRQIPAARRLAWHCHYCIFISPVEDAIRDKQAASWLELPEHLHPQALLFYAIVFLSGLGYVRKYQAARGIPESVTRDTLSDLELWIEKNYKRFGRWRFAEKRWLIRHFTNRIFKLGRLQFALEIFPSPLRAYRHKMTRQIVLLSESGYKFRQDGQYDGASGVLDPQAWTATLQADERTIQGQRIMPEGCARPEQITLAADEWQVVLRNGDAVLGVHIPEIGAMDSELCQDSFRQALQFFPRYFPDRYFYAFTCYSWLCNSVFDRLLPETSNIRKFQREWYLFPVPGANSDGFFVQLFGRTFSDWNDVPQTSSLLKAVVRHLKAGGQLNTGGALVFPEDLDWGRAVYRVGSSSFFNGGTCLGEVPYPDANNPTHCPSYSAT